jgi:hypothetical protein
MSFSISKTKGAGLGLRLDSSDRHVRRNRKAQLLAAPFISALSSE